MATIELTGDRVPPEVVAAFRQRAAFERARESRRAPEVHAPERRNTLAPATRSREHRAVGRRRTASRASPDDPSGPRPPLEVRSVARFQRDVQRAFGDAG